jgi:tetratricopeptide (TPR) repeat protein
MHQSAQIAPRYRFLMVIAGLAMSGCSAMANGPQPGPQRGPQPVLAQANTQSETDRTHKLAVETATALELAPANSDLIYKLLVAEFAIKRGQLPLAMDYYAEVARVSADPAIAERAVRLALMTRDNVRGLEASRLWSQLAKPNHSARQVYAAFLIRNGRIEEATTVLKQLSDELAATDDKVFNRIATMLSRIKPSNVSIQVMKSLVEGYPDNVEAQFALAQLLGRFGEQDQAKVVLDQVQKLEPDHERAAIYISQILIRSEKKLDAAQGLEEFLESNPDANTARLSYARLLVELKRHEHARTEFETLSKALPGNIDIAYALGLLLLQTNDPDSAEVQFKKIIKSPARRPMAWYYLGQIAESRKKIDDAIHAYKRVDRGEHRINAQIRIAVLLDNQGKLQDAQDQLHSIQGRNRQENIRLGRAEAEILRRNEKLQAAFDVYSELLKEYKTDTGLLYARAMLGVRLDNLEAAEQDFREVLSREPDNVDALNAFGYTLADRTERYTEAHALIQRAYELRPNDHYIVDSLGWVLYRMGRNEEALKLLRQALKIKADPEIAAHLGEVLWVMGVTAEAREVWDTALKGQPEDKRLLEVIKRFEK